MVTHKNYESDCRRIAKEIKKQASDPTGDTVLFGTAAVTVSESLVECFERIYQQDKKKFKKKLDNEINKYLKGFSAKFKYASVDYGHTVYIFDVEFDDVDQEFEDW